MLEKKVKLQCSQKANVQSHVRRARTAVSGIVGAYAGSGTEVLSKSFLQTKRSSPQTEAPFRAVRCQHGFASSLTVMNRFPCGLEHPFHKQNQGVPVSCLYLQMS